MSETVRDGSGGSDKLFETETLSLAAYGSLLYRELQGNWFNDVLRINISFTKARGQNQKCSHSLPFSVMSPTDVKHVFAGQAAETGDPVKSGIKPLHPVTLFHSLLISFCLFD